MLVLQVCFAFIAARVARCAPRCSAGVPLQVKKKKIDVDSPITFDHMSLILMAVMLLIFHFACYCVNTASQLKQSASQTFKGGRGHRV